MDRQDIVATVIIRTYNAQSLVERAVESALDQTIEEPYETFVLDDGSTDDTFSLLRRFGSAIRLEKYSHLGARPILNKAIRRAKAGLVTILDADDALGPDYLQELFEALRHNPDCSFSYCDYVDRTLDGEERIISLKENIFGSVAGGLLFERSKLLEVGLYDETLFFPEYDLLLKLEARGYTGIHVPRPLWYYTRAEGSMTSAKEKVRNGVEELERKWGRKLPIREY